MAAAAAASVVTILRVPFVPAVNTAVSLAEPVIVMTLPFIATSSTVKAVKVPRLVIFVCAAVANVPVIVPPAVIVPDISTLPLISIVVAAICISVSATKSNCPSAEEYMYIAVS